MPFQPIQAERLSFAVIRQIEQLILRGILRPGDRLPAERDLSERFGVSRPSLREAISDLQSRGLLDSRPGAGVFVAEVLGSAFSPALVNLFSQHEESVFDYLDFRRDMEGLAARRAAERGSDTDLAVIATIFAKMEQAHSKRAPEDEANLDAAFHMAIIEASHNVVMLHMMRSMYDLLKQGVFYNRQLMFRDRSTRSALLDQHAAINAALQSRDPAAARAAVDSHLDYVQTALRDQLQSDRFEEIARLRLDHENAR
ncbi:FadR/GntR family transcriptional regulator [Pseudorhodobacter sp.]|uniref:FadR/GntR family transcriptional regulator n=1 Tax=Pseudorhodobacter sp. TaxID=1934400 RepID=UPI002649BC66|nr:FCD domain-containing protein [Pseudorhodobacter sp.]MDN5787494.1 FCD domain-containing protein [Pseudorhodobacter sp.]